ncbi:MAG: signal recognition particle-docking protein FtsY [Mycoplasmoidaceae bacterium]
MGLFKKFIDKIKNKKLAKKIEEKNIENKSKIYKVKNLEQDKFDKGLKKSSNKLSIAIKEISKKYFEVNEEFFENLEEIFILSDFGISATNKIINAIREEIKFQAVKDPKLIESIIIDKIFVYYIQETDVDINLNLENNRTNIILVSGVNGVGKTTSIAKLANILKKDNKKVLLVAADTFRAGAIEQLEIWSERLKVEIVKPEKYGQDPSSVIYKGIKKGKDEKFDVVICDTSGRLENKNNLMEELKKMNKVIKNFDPSAPHEKLLVLDATTGQSGLNQAKVFKEIGDISGIILTKMDGTSKGGIILAIKDIFDIPVKFIGLGESLDDLAPFDLEMFITAITKDLDI